MGGADGSGDLVQERKKLRQLVSVDTKAAAVDLDLGPMRSQPWGLPCAIPAGPASTRDDRGAKHLFHPGGPAEQRVAQLGLPPVEALGG